MPLESFFFISDRSEQSSVVSPPLVPDRIPLKSFPEQSVTLPPQTQILQAKNHTCPPLGAANTSHHSDRDYLIQQLLGQLDRIYAHVITQANVPRTASHARGVENGTGFDGSRSPQPIFFSWRDQECLCT